MRTVILTLLTVLVLVIVGAFSFIYAGVYDVAATRPHWPVTYWVMDTVRTQSVKAQAVGITPPAGTMNDANVIVGIEHFAAHCASCHGAPGVPRRDIANGLYPRPANLEDTAQRYTPGELFWILKNGIKMSGMPAWADHSDDELWATVAFLEKLPAMREADYAKLVMESMTHGGGRHNHGAAEDEKPGNMPGMDHGSMPGMDHGAMPRMAPKAPEGQQH
jgi:mono/diheme cytochrome c family protein